MTFLTMESKEKKIGHINKMLDILEKQHKRTGDLIEIYHTELDEAYKGLVVGDLLAKSGILRTHNESDGGSRME